MLVRMNFIAMGMLMLMFMGMLMKVEMLVFMVSFHDILLSISCF